MTMHEMLVQDLRELQEISMCANGTLVMNNESMERKCARAAQIGITAIYQLLAHLKARADPEWRDAVCAGKYDGKSVAVMFGQGDNERGWPPETSNERSKGI